MKLIIGLVALGLSICSLVMALLARREHNKAIARLIENQRAMNEMNNKVNFYKESK